MTVPATPKKDAATAALTAASTLAKTWVTDTDASARKDAVDLGSLLTGFVSSSHGRLSRRRVAAQVCSG
jgi:hypothetical protein